MPRIERGLVEGYPYHILNRGNGKQEVFHQDSDYRNFIDLMKRAKLRHPIKILAYCLMPNHFHMVLIPVQTSGLSRWMQWLMTSHVRRYHWLYGTDGHIWQGRFKSFLIEADDHLLTILRYVEANPVRAGLVRSAKDWPWSSYQERLGGRHLFLLDPLPIELPKDWFQYVDTPLTEKELEEIQQAVSRQSPFGTTHWRQKIATSLGIESTLRSRGRPKK